MTVVTFTAHGLPASQGSKVRTKFGGMRESSKRLAPWREQVATRAAEAMNGRALITGPVEVKCWFWFPRGKGHFGTGKNAGQLKASAPQFYAQTPDVDKASRAILDGIAGQIIRNDAQVVTLLATKVWGEPARAVVEVREL